MRPVTQSVFALALVLAIPTTSIALGMQPRVESADMPEKNLSAPISQNRSVAATSFATASATGPNLIQNASVESASGAVPTGWSKGGYGTNSRTLTYPVNGTSGSSSKAIQVTLSNYSSGDAKWFFNFVAINPEAKYQFSNYSKSNVSSIVTVQYKLTDGTFAYKDLGSVGPSTSFQKNTFTLAPPANATSLTIFHLLKQNGTLVTDEYSLQEISQPPPPDPENMVQNGEFEAVGSNSLPSGWSKGGYGTNTRVFTYPISGATASGARIDVSGYTSGDAKWVFTPVPASSGVYTYSDIYQSNVQTILTAQLKKNDGTFVYQDLRVLPPSSSWTPVSVDLSVPTGISEMTVFHLIKSNGSLSLDSVSLKKKTTTGTGIFSTGAVTFRFDDGLTSQYTNAYPKLESTGIKASFYIASKQIADNGFADVMSVAQIKDLFAHGHEIGSHTRNHPDLATLSGAQLQAEVLGSKQDIAAWSVGPVNSFSYPYGSYTTATIQAVKDAGYQSALATINGYGGPSSDKYQLERQSITNTTTFAQVKQWVDTAASNHSWLILEFHGIDLSGTTYSMTPTVFNQVVDYVKQKGIPTVTASVGAQQI